MSLEEHVQWWETHYPIQFGILCNALGKDWILEKISECIGATFEEDYHPFGWKCFQSNGANLTEVLLVVKFLSEFARDENISTVIEELKNPQKYDATFTHLCIAHQFMVAGWDLNLEYETNSNVVDICARNNGELAFIECSQKVLPQMMPFNERAKMKLMSQFTSRFGSMSSEIILTGEDVTLREIQTLIDQNEESLRSFEDTTNIESENCRIECVRPKVKPELPKGECKLRDRRPSKSLAERLIDKIRVEHKQTKSAIATRVVCLQVFGKPTREEWLAALNEVYSRMEGRSSKPDAVFLFKRRWTDESCFMDIIGFMAFTEKGEVFTPVSEVFNQNEELRP